MNWLDAWKDATTRHFAPLPDEVRSLVSLHNRVAYTAPEVLPNLARFAWGLYQEQGDTEIGRCAVAFTYALQADNERPRGA